MNEQKINRLIERRNKLTNRRDGLTDSAVIARIDAQLRDVPPGQDNRVDLLLGRSCAVLPDRANERWSTDEQRAAWKASGAAEAARLAEEKRGDFLQFIADQHEDMQDFLQIRGNLAL